MAFYNDLEIMSAEELRQAANPVEATVPNVSPTRYWEGINPVFTALTNPAVAVTYDDLIPKEINWEDPEVKTMMSQVDTGGQIDLASANSLEHMRKIFAQKKIREEALKEISQEELGTQLMKGVLPAIMSPTSLLPVGAVGLAFKTAKTATRLANAARVGIVGAVGAGAMAAADEALFEAQGVEGHPVSALVWGGVLGGTIGGTIGAIFAKSGHDAGKALAAENDSWTKDFKNDPDLVVSIDEKGVAKVEVVPPDGEALSAVGRDVDQQRKFWFDRMMPFLNSDVTKVYTGVSPAARKMLSKIVKPSAAAFDKNGNPIVFGETAYTFKIKRNKAVTIKDSGIHDAFKEAKQNGFTGSKDEFIDVVSDISGKLAQHQENDLHLYIRQVLNEFDANNPIREGMTKEELSSISKQRNKLKTEATKTFYDKYELPTKDIPNSLLKGFEAYRGFFQDHLATNQSLKLAGADKIHKNRIYSPKIVNWDTIKQDVDAMKQLRDDVYMALKTHPANDDILEEELRRMADAYTKTLEDVEYRMNFSHDSYFVPKDEPASSRLKDRTMYLNEEHMRKYRVTNMEELTGRYHYQMSGRQALKFGLGTDSVADTMKQLQQEMLKIDGKVDAEAIDQVRNIIRDIAGDLRINALSDTPAWTFTRNLQNYNSIRLGWGFGANQLIELVTAEVMMGLPNLRNGQFFSAFRETAKMMINGTLKDSSDFAKLLVDAGYMEDALHTSNINKYADTEMGWNPGNLEKWGQGIQDKMYKYNGVRFFKTTMEHLAGTGMITNMQKMFKKKSLSKLDLTRLSEWGLDETTFRRIMPELNDKIKFGKNGKMDLANMDPEVRAILQNSITEMMEGVVIQGNSIHLPTWFKVPGPTKNLITQFMRFPMITHSIYMRRGFTSEQAGMLAASLSSIITYMGIKYLREQAAVALGYVKPYQTQFDYFDDGRKGEEALKRGVGSALNYVAPLGMLGTSANMLLRAGGAPALGSDYRGQAGLSTYLGPSAGAFEDALKITNEAFNNDYSTESTMLKAKGLIIPRVGVIDEGITEMIRRKY